MKLPEGEILEEKIHGSLKAGIQQNKKDDG